MTDLSDVEKASSNDFREIGSSGLVQYGGEVKEDFLRALQGKSGYANYTQMADNDPVIGACLHAIEMMIRGVDWTVEPVDIEDQKAVDAAEFCAGCLNDMSQTWADTLSNIMSMLVYGFSFHEIVYKRRKGRTGKSNTNSKYNDNKIGWRKLAIRNQNTVYKWDLDKNGGINGMYQQDIYAGLNSSMSYIPIEKALLFRTSTKMNNPRGRSVLRNAFVPWYMKSKIQEIEAIGVERDLAGMPIALVPPHLLSDNATSQESSALSAIKQIVRNIKRDEQEGIVFPLAYDDDGNLAYDLKLLSTGGARQFDTSDIINRYDQRIAMSLLADFVLLGHEKVGTQALSVSKIQLFTDSLDAWLHGIADVVTNYGFARLLRLNGIDEELTPKLRYSPPRNIDLDGLSKFIQQISGAGAMLFPDEGLESYLREVAGLPADSAENI
jgi:hypothetical protein